MRKWTWEEKLERWEEGRREERQSEEEPFFFFPKWWASLRFVSQSRGLLLIPEFHWARVAEGPFSTTLRAPFPSLPSSFFLTPSNFRPPLYLPLLPHFSFFSLPLISQKKNSVPKLLLFHFFIPLHFRIKADFFFRN